MNRLFHRLAFVAAMAVAVTAPAHAADFLKAIDDVPLAKGMTEQPEPVVFESEQGRVVRTSITGNTPCKDVDAFYAKTLPALGWGLQPGKGGSMAFKRDNEQLTLSTICIIADAPYATQLSFELVVKLAGTRLPE